MRGCETGSRNNAVSAVSAFCSSEVVGAEARRVPRGLGFSSIGRVRGRRALGRRQGRQPCAHPSGGGQTTGGTTRVPSASVNRFVPSAYAMSGLVARSSRRAGAEWTASSGRYDSLGCAQRALISIVAALAALNFPCCSIISCSPYLPHRDPVYIHKTI
jgi:hypothetical protein